MTRGVPAPLFGDPHTDGRLRALIPHFAKLGVLLAAATSPFVAPSGTRLALLLANAALALVVTVAVERSGLLHRASHFTLQVLLLFFVTQIALGAAISGTLLAYGPLQLLPVVFAAQFFSGWRRYFTAIAAAVIEYALCGPIGILSLEISAVRAVTYLMLAHFGAHVADTLHDALRANQALHSVLEVASGDPLAPELAQIGLDAALGVVGWDAGAVALEADGELELVALRGFDPTVAEHYRRHPIRVGDGSMTDRVFQTGRPHDTADLRGYLGDDHPIVTGGFASNAGVPIRYHGQAIGVLIVDHRSRRIPNDDELERLGKVAEQLGLAIGNARSHRREAHVAAELRELNRRKDEFLATISHELRTPATTINLAARTLAHFGARLDEAHTAEAHETLVRRSAELCELVDSLVEQAVADAGGLQLSVGWIDWRSALAEWTSAVESRSGREIELSLPDEPVNGMVDAVKIERVIVNLLHNAINFSEPDTTIRCELTSDGDSVRVAVTDQGAGIAPQHLPHVFDRFFQVDSSATRQHGGFGIGLSLVRHFVRAHGGDVTVTSEVGVGSTFAVSLPRHALVQHTPGADPPPYQRGAWLGPSAADTG